MLHALDQERSVSQMRALRTPRALSERIRACVDGDGERTWLGPRSMKNIAAVARAHVHQNVAERSGYRNGLTDVHVHKAFAKKRSHEEMLLLPRGIDRLERVPDEPLCTA